MFVRLTGDKIYLRRDILDHLNNYELRIFVFLCAHANKQNIVCDIIGRGYSQRTLSIITNATRHALKKNLPSLEQKGFIKINDDKTITIIME